MGIKVLLFVIALVELSWYTYAMDWGVFVNRPCAIRVSYRAHLGNQMTTLLSGMQGALVYNTSLIFNNTDICIFDWSSCHHDLLPLNVTVLVDRQPPAGSCEGYLDADAWKISPITRQIISQQKDTGRLLRHHLALAADPQLVEIVRRPSTLTMYLRAGDVFDRNYHASYIQAPCCFYTKVLQDVSPSVVVIVTASLANDSNPCALTMSKQFPSIQFHYVLDSVSRSYALLAHASRLVLSGISTFGTTASQVALVPQQLIVPTFHFEQQYHTPITTNELADTVVTRYLVHGYPKGGQWSASVAHHQILEDFPVTQTNLSSMDIPLNNFFLHWFSYSTVLVVKEGVDYVGALRIWFELTEVHQTQKSRQIRPNHPVGMIVLADCTGVSVDVAALRREFSVFQTYFIAAVKVEEAAYPCQDIIPTEAAAEGLNAFNTTHLVVLHDNNVAKHGKFFDAVMEDLAKLRRTGTFAKISDSMQLVATSLGRSCCDHNRELLRDTMLLPLDRSP